MKKYTFSGKLKRLYIISFSGIIILAVVLMSVISIQTQKEQAYRFCESLVDLNLKLLDSNLKQIQKGQKMVVEDVRLRAAVKGALRGNEIDYSQQLVNQWEMNDKLRLLSMSNNFDNIYIASKEGTCLFSYQGSIRTNGLKEEGWFQDISGQAVLNTAYATKVHDRAYQVNKSEKLCISMVMPIVTDQYSVGGRPDAFLICDVDLGRMIENDRSDVQFVLEGYSVGKDGDVSKNLYAQQIEEAVNRWSQSQEADGAVISVINSGVMTKWLLVSKQSQIFGLEIAGIKELREIRSTFFIMLLLLVLILLLSGILTYFLANRTAKVLAEPIDRLVDQCREVAKGNYNVEFQEKNSYEVAVLSDTIRKMIRSIMSLNEKVVSEEKMLSEEKLRALQHQINPHFVNNVLQSIKSLAVSGENEKISHLSTFLGRNMAYSVYMPYQTVTLGEEIEHVKNYLDIQNIRLDNKILYSVDCPENLRETQMLKLTLQPVLENTVEHGLKKGTVEIITISVEEDGGDVVIMVSDNGTGIPGDKLQRLRTMLESGDARQQEKSIGVLNVNERIRKKFGRKYGLSLLSREGAGTTVIVRLPGSKERENESITC